MGKPAPPKVSCRNSFIPVLTLTRYNYKREIFTQLYLTNDNYDKTLLRPYPTCI